MPVSGHFCPPAPPPQKKGEGHIILSLLSLLLLLLLDFVNAVITELFHFFESKQDFFFPAPKKKFQPFIYDCNENSAQAFVLSIVFL